jgi:hypothetical protein
MSSRVDSVAGSGRASIRFVHIRARTERHDAHIVARSSLDSHLRQGIWIAIELSELRVGPLTLEDSAVIETKLQSEYANLRDQFIVMLILAVAIALRSIFIGSGEAPSSSPNMSTANEVQHDAIHQKLSSSEGLRSTNSKSGLRLNDMLQNSSIHKETQK